MDYPSMPNQTSDDIKRKSEMAKIHATPVTINGATVPIKSLYPDEHSARDFHSKVQLLGAGKGSIDDNGNTDTDADKLRSSKETGDEDEGEPDDEGLHEMLFGGAKAKPKGAKTASTETDNEPDMAPSGKNFKGGEQSRRVKTFC